MHRALLAIAATALLAGCAGTTTVHGSGHVVTQSRHVSAFDRIELKGAAKVDVTVGAPRSVAVRTDDNLLRRVRTTVDGGVLVISEKGNYSTEHGVTVEIAVPSLVGATLGGAGSVTVDGIAAKAFELALDGAGSFDLGGSVDRLDATLNGVGSAALEHLQAKDVQVSVNGTGSAHVYATRSLDATVRGVGSVLYTGSPKQVHETVTGLGSVVES